MPGDVVFTHVEWLKSNPLNMMILTVLSRYEYRKSCFLSPPGNVTFPCPSLCFIGAEITWESKTFKDEFLFNQQWSLISFTSNYNWWFIWYLYMEYIHKVITSQPIWYWSHFKVIFLSNYFECPFFLHTCHPIYSSIFLFLGHSYSSWQVTPRLRWKSFDGVWTAASVNDKWSP